MKKKWLIDKDNFINGLKIMILITSMTMGLWIIYAMLWNAVGLPVVDWSLWLLFAFAICSEVLYIKWIS